jgi:hypothetical protein
VSKRYVLDQTTPKSKIGPIGVLILHTGEEAASPGTAVQKRRMHSPGEVTRFHSPRPHYDRGQNSETLSYVLLGFATCSQGRKLIKHVKNNQVHFLQIQERLFWRRTTHFLQDAVCPEWACKIERHPSIDININICIPSA